MNRQEIDQAALDLYRDPSRRQYLRDALEELRPAVSWGQWLEESGTLERLAECMVYTCHGDPTPDGPSYKRANGDHWNWRDSVGAGYSATNYYPALCAAFGVPAVMIEVGQTNEIAQPYNITLPPDTPGVHYRFLAPSWSAPSVPLALAVLMEAVTLMGIPGTGMTAADLPGLLAHHHSWGREVRQHAPSATAYRIRLADGQWTERRI